MDTTDKNGTEHEDKRKSQDLVGHLQSIREDERISLATAMHDELGGSLVAAVMDISWVEQHLSSGNPEEIAQHLTRAAASLRSAIDLERLLTERLRPTLLDNFGLFAAFRWHFKQSGARSNLPCTDRYPDTELLLTPAALTGLFRIVEGLLRMTFAEQILEWVDLTVSVDGGDLCILITQGHGTRAVRSNDGGATNELDDVEHRVRALHGVLHADRHTGGSSFGVVVPLPDILLAA